MILESLTYYLYKRRARNHKIPRGVLHFLVQIVRFFSFFLPLLRLGFNYFKFFFFFSKFFFCCFLPLAIASDKKLKTRRSKLADNET